MYFFRQDSAFISASLQFQRRIFHNLAKFSAISQNIVRTKAKTIVRTIHRDQTRSPFRGEVSVSDIIDMAEMREKFYESYEPSLHWSLIDDFIQDPNKMDADSYLGGGQHFNAWKVEIKGASPKAVSISNHYFYEELGSKGMMDWIDMMGVLKNERLPLVPPFELVSRGDHVAVMMPFGEIDRKKTKSPSPLLLSEMEKLGKELKMRRLEINDVLQIRYSQSGPFVCDFSDLGRI